MSRIGKIPVTVPKNVKVKLEGHSIACEGPKGKLSLPIPQGVRVEQKDNQINIQRDTDKQQHRANHGTVRSLVQNMIDGVTEGHKVRLQIQGVGFRAQVKGKEIELSLGFSHPVVFPIPADVQVKAAKPTEIEIEGVDKAAVGEVAAKIRQFKPPEPYKGKGIRYVDEMVRRKQGKSVTK